MDGLEPCGGPAIRDRATKADAEEGAISRLAYSGSESAVQTLYAVRLKHACQFSPANLASSRSSIFSLVFPLHRYVSAECSSNMQTDGIEHRPF